MPSETKEVVWYADTVPEFLTVKQRFLYVLGGPLQAEVEARKRSNNQPRSEFNLFTERNHAELASTDQVGGGEALSLRRRIALTRAVLRRAADYDVLVTSGEDIGIPLAIGSIASKHPKPIWIILHGSYLQSFKFRIIAPLLRRARHVHFLCLSGSLRAMMVEKHGFAAARCHNTGYGVDTAFFSPAPPGQDVLVVSAGSANRDYPTLMSATEGMGVRVRIAADSLWRPKDPGMTAEHVPDCVQIGSAGSYEGLRSLYRQASIVVVPLHPARYACGYAVIAEAMAMGKVVIATRTTALSDLLVDGKTGYYVEPADVADLRAKIRLLLENPGKAEEMGTLAAERMRTMFSLEAYCEKIERTISEAGAM